MHKTKQSNMSTSPNTDEFHILYRNIPKKHYKTNDVTRHMGVFAGSKTGYLLDASTTNKAYALPCFSFLF